MKYTSKFSGEEIDSILDTISSANTKAAITAKGYTIEEADQNR